MIRVHHNVTFTDTYSLGTIDYDQDIYVWYKAGTHMELAQVQSTTYDFGSYTSGYYIESTADIQEVTDVTFHVYPNPVNDYVSITPSKNIQIQKIEITDMNGKIVKTLNETSAVLESIDVNSLERGIYLMRIYSDNQMFTAKIKK